MGKWFAVVLVLTVLLGATSCNGQVEEIRQETLAEVETALTAAYELTRNSGLGDQMADGLLELVPDLEQAAQALGDNTERSEDCLAEALTHLLDADRKLAALSESAGADEVGELTSLMAPVRAAASRVYDHFYGNSSASGDDDWRGPPTPRPPGVCPGG